MCFLSCLMHIYRFQTSEPGSRGHFHVESEFEFKNNQILQPESTRWEALFLHQNVGQNFAPICCCLFRPQLRFGNVAWLVVIWVFRGRLLPDRCSAHEVSLFFWACVKSNRFYVFVAEISRTFLLGQKYTPHLFPLKCCERSKGAVKSTGFWPPSVDILVYRKKILQMTKYPHRLQIIFWKLDFSVQRTPGTHFGNKNGFWGFWEKTVLSVFLNQNIQNTG